MHPVAFMLTSHECAEDYEFFYSSLKNVCSNLNIQITISYLMQDACKAESSALRNSFGNSTIILMCWFHVMLNVKKNFSAYGVPEQIRESVQSDIVYLHYSTTRTEFDQRVNYILYKWQCHQITLFIEYFKKQWLSPPFENWQLYCRPPGYATVNCCEPLNKQIKETWTGFKRLHILDTFKKVIEKICLYYSTHPKPFAFYPSSKTFDKAIVAKSEKLKCEQFYQEYVNGVLDINSIRFWKKNVMGQYYTRLIQIVPYFCNCPTFKD